MYSYDEPVYLISVVAKILEIHPQTLRQYEKEGLIQPGRTDGKMRLYSQRDIDKIKTILKLTRDMGVILAGVREDPAKQKGKNNVLKTSESSYEIILFQKK